MRKVKAERKGVRVEVTHTLDYDASQLGNRINQLERDLDGYDRQLSFIQSKQGEAQDELDQLRLLQQSG